MCKASVKPSYFTLSWATGRNFSWEIITVDDKVHQQKNGKEIANGFIKKGRKMETAERKRNPQEKTKGDRKPERKKEGERKKNE